VRNKAAEICEKYPKKGDKVYIEGRIKTRKWTDDKGMERYSTEIQCTDFTFLSDKNQSEHGNSSNNASEPNVVYHAEPVNQPPNINVEGDDDLPF
jgi:single-strand DNA-binding protein